MLRISLLLVAVMAATAFAAPTHELKNADLIAERAQSFAEHLKLGGVASDKLFDFQRATSSLVKLRAVSATCQAAASDLLTAPTKPGGGSCSDFGSSFMAQSASITEAQVDTFCKDPCTSLWAAKFDSLITACKSDIEASQADMSIMSSNMLGSLVEMMCLKNENGKYCLVAIQAMGDSAATTTDMASACKPAKDLGCCLSAYYQKAMDMMAQSPMPQAQKDQMKAEMEKGAKQMADTCGINMVAGGCAAVGGKFTGVAKLKGFTVAQYNALSAEKKEAVKTAARADIAAKAQVAFKQVSVTIATTRQSDISVNYEITSIDTATATAAKTNLETGTVSFASVETAAALPANSVTAEVTAGSVEAVALPGSGSTASSLQTSAALLLAALVAMLALMQ